MKKIDDLTILDELERKMENAHPSMVKKATLNEDDMVKVISKAIESPKDYSSSELNDILDAWKDYKKEERAKLKIIKKLRRIIDTKYSVSRKTTVRIFLNKLKGE